jgi:hypothetical protein
MEMPSTGVRTDACYLRLSGVSHIESGPTRRMRWTSVPAMALYQALNEPDAISMSDLA